VADDSPRCRRQPRVNGIVEIAGVSEVLLAEFSARTTGVDGRFIATFERKPIRRERWRLEWKPQMESRPSKTPDRDRSFSIGRSAVADNYENGERRCGRSRVVRPAPARTTSRVDETDFLNLDLTPGLPSTLSVASRCFDEFTQLEPRWRRSKLVRPLLGAASLRVSLKLIRRN
jgi:hypothetical protein